MLATLLGFVFKVVGTAALATIAVIATIYLIVAGLVSQF